MHCLVSLEPALIQESFRLRFGSPGSKDYLKEKSFWYGSPADDRHLRDVFSNDYEAAKNGQYDDWMQEGSGEGALALIILLDQIP
ncbi:hypothetical protein VTN00DRAFT_6202 [Thermoascus crustaceus]|uniref:uncharacterized protein n=1 Tax=Thermoascus crustaceus TaxID=5088 RepID=UPI003742100F